MFMQSLKMLACLDEIQFTNVVSSSSSVVYLIHERTSQEKLVSVFILRVFTYICASIIIIPVTNSQVQRCLSVNPITYWMAALIWDTAVSLVFVTIAACIIQAFQVIASSFTALS